MCGIFAAVGPLREGALAGASAALAHRGPDAEGVWRGDDVTLLHRRLAIIDLSPAGEQPMCNEDRSVWVTFNGEIFNHHALRRELTSHTFRSRSDTEVILHGYEEWGDAVVARLDGQFAFALWDTRKKRLLVARDRTGKKPLFYAEQSGTLFMGSSIESMRAAGLGTQPDLEQLPFLLAYGFVPAPHTMHAGVKQLPPATYFVREGDEPIRPITYWQPTFSAPENTRDSFEMAAARVRELVRAAVERRLESDVPLGAFLSGGVDSTIIVGLMAELAGRKIKTFSIGFAGDSRYDETRYAKIAADAFGTDHTEFHVAPSSLDLIEKLVALHDGPFGDSSAIPTSIVAELTRQHVTVALTGDGGDEVFCGYERFLAAEASEKIPLALRQLAARAARFLPGASRSRSIYSKAQRFLDSSALPLADRLAYLNAFFHDPRTILSRDVANALDTEAPLRWQRKVTALSAGASPLKRILDHNFRTYLPYDLLIKADRCSMAHSLEARSPFLDTALIEYAGTLPDAYLRRGTQTKRILRHAFKDLIPQPIMTRSKMGFGMPLGTWFRGQLRSYLYDHLSPRSKICAYIDPAAMQTLLDEHDAGRADHGQKLWLLLTFDVWLRQLAAAPAQAAA